MPGVAANCRASPRNAGRRRAMPGATTRRRVAPRNAGRAWWVARHLADTTRTCRSHLARPSTARPRTAAHRPPSHGRPQLLGVTASSGIVAVLLEVTAIKLTFYLLQAARQPPPSHRPPGRPPGRPP
eukprot:3916039-Prymnesium_polylepis.1